MKEREKEGEGGREGEKEGGKERGGEWEGDIERGEGEGGGKERRRGGEGWGRGSEVVGKDRKREIRSEEEEELSPPSHLSSNEGRSDIERRRLDLIIWSRHPVSVNPDQILDTL